MKKFLILMTIAVIMNCKARPQNELQYWNISQKEYAEAVVKYPNFKVILETKMKDA